jgi:hypothetical protein
MAGKAVNGVGGDDDDALDFLENVSLNIKKGYRGA